jgi:CheY-like chemotaxis protein
MRDRRASSRPTLLVVDDDGGVRRVLRDMLHRAGYAVREAADGAAALEALAGTLPDAIVLDVVLPGVSGLDLLDRLSASGVCARVPVIAITGSVVPDAVIREKGARGILRKPFSFRELCETIEEASRGTIMR